MESSSTHAPNKILVKTNKRIHDQGTNEENSTGKSYVMTDTNRETDHLIPVKCSSSSMTILTLFQVIEHRISDGTQMTKVVIGNKNFLVSTDKLGGAVYIREFLRKHMEV